MCVFMWQNVQRKRREADPSDVEEGSADMMLHDIVFTDAGK